MKLAKPWSKWSHHRGGRQIEAGELIAFLLGDRAGFMTGAVINIDGGTDF